MLHLRVTVFFFSFNVAVKRKKKEVLRRKHFFFNVRVCRSHCINHPPHIHPKRNHSRTVYGSRLTCYQSGGDNQKPLADSKSLLMGMQLEQRQRSHSME